MKRQNQYKPIQPEAESCSKYKILNWRLRRTLYRRLPPHVDYFQTSPHNQEDPTYWTGAPTTATCPGLPQKLTVDHR